MLKSVILKSVVMAAIGFNLSSAHGSIVSVECKPDQLFAGTGATVSGELELTAFNDSTFPEGYIAYLAEGNLEIFIGGSTATSVFKDVVLMRGYYEASPDFLGPFASLASVDANAPVVTAYLNFNRPNASYIESDGVMYSTTCKEFEVPTKDGEL